MNIINSILSENLINALGWTIIHSLWQGAAAALGFERKSRGQSNFSSSLTVAGKRWGAYSLLTRVKRLLCPPAPVSGRIPESGGGALLYYSILFLR